MKKLVALALAILILAIASTVVRDIKHTKAIENWLENGKEFVITVEYGDTLDGYYAEYAPKFVNRYEFREAIMELNNMSTCNLYAGNSITLIKEAN